MFRLLISTTFAAARFHSFAYSYRRSEQQIYEERNEILQPRWRDARMILSSACDLHACLYTYVCVRFARLQSHLSHNTGSSVGAAISRDSFRSNRTAPRARSQAAGVNSQRRASGREICVITFERVSEHVDIRYDRCDRWAIFRNDKTSGYPASFPIRRFMRQSRNNASCYRGVFFKDYIYDNTKTDIHLCKKNILRDML